MVVLVQHVFRETRKRLRLRTIHTHTIHTHRHTASLPGRQNAHRARVEEGVACMGESHNVERGRERERERERERGIEFIKSGLGTQGPR